MGGLTHQLDLAHTEPLGEGVEADGLGLRESRNAIRAVAIHPFHVVMFLPGGFNEIAEERLVIFGKIHVGVNGPRGGERVKADHTA